VTAERHYLESWTSREAQEEFMNNRLGAAMAEGGVTAEGVTDADYRSVTEQLGLDLDTGKGDWPAEMTAHLTGLGEDGRAFVVEALALHEGAELPLERVSTLLSYGSMLRQSGQPARARKVLSEALEVADATAAPALARYARVELALTGGRRRRRNPSGHLTAQELRVARLAKAGASRRDIAERLTLSEATVRTHLEHIYTKLDIHSARELMTSNFEQLADHDTP
jgi:DNA-binding CsgD family transcriptional regulator